MMAGQNVRSRLPWCRDKITCDGLLLPKTGNQCEVFDGECLVLLCLLPIIAVEIKIIEKPVLKG
jgi:hypothetical protein